MHSSRQGVIAFAAMSAFLLASCGGGGGGTTFPILPAPAPAPVPSPPPPPPAPPPSPAPSPAPAPAVQLKGAIDTPVSFNVADLTARAPVTQTVSFSSAGAAQSHIYTGANVFSLLSNAGIQTDAARKNDVLSRYVMATGADGYRVLFTLGELSPDFGNKPSVVAYAETTAGSSAPLSATDGPFRITAPGDIKGGRYVSNLTRLDVVPSATTITASTGGVATTFAVSGQVNTPMTFDLTTLQAMTATTQVVGANTYKGVSLWTLLNGLGLTLPASVKNPTLTMYAVATGSDGYRAAVSLGEIDPGFGNKTALVAYEMNGAGLGANGVARLIVPGEVKQGRSVSNLVAIEVFTAPAPAP